VLRTIAEWNPVTAMSEALRELFGNPQGDFGADPPWPLEHPAAYSLIWIAAIIAICAPLAIRAYQRTVAR
jgi:ABC-2 type transport system permease protein